MTTDLRTFRRKAAVELRRLTGAGILVDAQGNHFGVNQVGVRIWELLDDAGSVDSLVEALLREFDISDMRCREEAEAFLSELLARELVERAERR
jgi:predicted DNA-binding transcriptional regulator